eukprot:gnl/MRDRNA2_/MRDRNA2_56525_c0_seq1.p1 gnl/MRDRNA2_/MRDRNA2_56525_c0~~gnl/MRDRNA2_/MRDRNA2_56525_c0_seq1.p1  ORF type:complete len:639 (+),score=125.88 gnl/MRDRNA2_/MRDRNA2_56525_c0_seq1:272-1918(+)
MAEDIASGSPTVIIKHSGKASDFFGWVGDALAEGKTKTSEVLSWINEKYPFWYSEGYPDALYSVGSLGVSMQPYVDKILVTHNSNPAAMKKSFVVVNGFLSPPAKVLMRLSNALAEAGIEDLESKDHDRDAIISAWQQHALLHHNAAYFRKLADRLTYGGLVVSFFSTFTAATSMADVSSVFGSSLGHFLEVCAHYLLIILPALGSLIMTVLSKMRFVNKWADCHMAAVQTECEIYKFRMRTGIYDDTIEHLEVDENQDKAKDKDKDKKKSKDKDKDPALALKSKTTSPRHKFVARSSRLFSRLLRGEMAEDMMQQAESATHLKSRLQSIKSRKSKLDGIKKAIIPIFEKVSLLEPLLPPKDEMHEKALEEGYDMEPDDLVSTMNIEQYIEYRTMTLLEEYKEDQRPVAKRLHYLEMLIFIASLLSTLFGAMQMKEWIPVTVALISLINAFIQYGSFSGRLNAKSAAISELSSIVASYRSMDVVEQRTRTVKNLIVEVVENSVLRDAMALVGNAGAAVSVTNLGTDSGQTGAGGDVGGSSQQGKQKSS